jgi:hypothetical protein
MTTEPRVCIAILAKQKESMLPLFLRCIEDFSYPKTSICLYVRTNNNTDRTAEILKEWIDENKSKYESVFFDDSDVDTPVQKYGVHEWNEERFKVLGKIREDSVKYAYETVKADYYFVMDVDNCVVPETLSELVKLKLPIVAPFIINADPGNNRYANFFSAINSYGFMEEISWHDNVILGHIRGILIVPLVHCTYLIDRETMPKVKYLDSTGTYEFIVFSRNARKLGINQYLDCRKQYGWLSLKEDVETLREKMYPDIPDIKEKATINTRYRMFIEKFIRDNQIKSILDYSCGDWRHKKDVNWGFASGVTYLGVSTCRETIEKNQKYSTDKVKFELLTHHYAKIPQVDLIICKDVLNQLPSQTNIDIIEAFKKSCKMMLITVEDGVMSSCNKTGGKCPIKLSIHPYSFNAFDELTFKESGVIKTVNLIHS